MDITLAIKYITNTANKKEKTTFEKWLTQADANQKKYERFILDWEKSAEGLKDYYPDAHDAWNKFALKMAIHKINNSIDKTRIIMSKWRSIAAVAAIIITMGVLLFYVSLSNSNRFKSYTVYTTNDSLKSVILEDGSTIWLNKYSELKVPNWKEKDDRMVYLKGEAFFEVAYNAQRPFLVQTEYTTTRVLGTSFNLTTTNEQDLVSLVSGKIQFYPSNADEKAVILVPGEMLNYNHLLKQFEKSKFNDNNFIAWKTGELNFKNAPLPKVLYEISDYYELKLSGNTKGYESYSLTANFNKQPIEKLISVLELTWNASITVSSDTLYLNFNPMNP